MKMNINQAVKILKNQNELVLVNNNTQARLFTNIAVNWINIPIQIKTLTNFNCILPPIINKISELVDLENALIDYQSNTLKIKFDNGEYLLNSPGEYLLNIPSDEWSNQYIPLNKSLMNLIFKAQNFSNSYYGIKVSIHQDKATVQATNGYFWFTEAIPFYNSLFKDFKTDFVLDISTINLLKKFKKSGKIWVGSEHIKIELEREISIIANIRKNYRQLSINNYKETQIVLNRQELIKKITLLGASQKHQISMTGENSEILIKGFVNDKGNNLTKIGETKLKANINSRVMSSE